jgi:hypothetical protein
MACLLLGLVLASIVARPLGVVFMRDPSIARMTNGQWIASRVPTRAPRA